MTEPAQPQQSPMPRQPEHLGPGERYQQPNGGRVYIQSSETDADGVRTRTRLYDDGTVQVDRFGVDTPGAKHSHAIDDAQLARGDEQWDPVYRRELGGKVTFDRGAAAKRQALIDEATALSANGGFSKEDAARLRAQWRNTGSTRDPARDLQFERTFRGLVGPDRNGLSR